MTFAGAVPGPDGQPLDQIRITGVSATGYHGVLAHEREQGQLFRADVVLHVDTRAAASGDDLGATVSYADVAQDAHAVLAGPPADLIETVAERIAAAALAYPSVQAVDVRVHKPQAPIQVPFDDVEIAIRRDRVRTPVVAPLPAEGEPEARPDADEVYAGFEVAPDLAAQTADAEPYAERGDDVESAPGPVETTAGAFGPAAIVPPAPEAVPAPPVATASGAVPGPPYEQAPGPVPAPAPEPEPEPEAPVDPLDAAPDTPVEVVIALGANLGEAQATLRTAVTDLDRIPGLQVTEVSPLARTAAVGGPEQPDFLNAVLLARTTLSPRDLLRACQAVEAQHGRVRHEQWGPRTLDVDIVQYGTMTASADDLELPHPRARERAFVLVPWAEVAPDAVLVGLGGGPVAQLAATAPDRTGIRWLALDWLTDTATGPAPTGSQPSAGADPYPAPSAPYEASAPIPQQEAPPQQPVPPSIAPTPPHGVPPTEASYGAPQVHEPVPPAPEQLPPPVDPPSAPTSGEALHPMIDEVPLQTLVPRPFRPDADEEYLAPPPLPVRHAPDSSLPVPPVPPVPQQSFPPAPENPFPAPPGQQQQSFPPASFPPAPESPFPAPPAQQQPFPPAPENPFPPLTDNPFSPVTENPFPPSGPVTGGDGHR